MATIMRLSLWTMLREYVYECWPLVVFICSALGIAIYFHLDSTVLPPLHCVEPHEYHPFACSPWQYDEATVSVFEQVALGMHALRSEMNATTLTARHVGYGFCMLVVQTRTAAFTMLNPRLVQSTDKRRRIQETSPLCEHSVSKARFTNITLQWLDLHNNTVQQEFATPEAYHLQHALDILDGTFACTL